MKNEDFEELYEQTAKGEDETRTLLIQLDQDYPNTLKESNVEKIAGTLQKKADRTSILAQLHEKKALSEPVKKEAP